MSHSSFLRLTWFQIPRSANVLSEKAGAVGGTVVDHENLRGTVDVFAQESRHLFERSG